MDRQAQQEPSRVAVQTDLDSTTDRPAADARRASPLSPSDPSPNPIGSASSTGLQAVTQSIAIPPAVRAARRPRPRRRSQAIAEAPSSAPSPAVTAFVHGSMIRPYVLGQEASDLLRAQALGLDVLPGFVVHADVMRRALAPRATDSASAPLDPTGVAADLRAAIAGTRLAVADADAVAAQTMDLLAATDPAAGAVLRLRPSRIPLSGAERGLPATADNVGRDATGDVEVPVTGVGRTAACLVDELPAAWASALDEATVDARASRGEPLSGFASAVLVQAVVPEEAGVRVVAHPSARVVRLYLTGAGGAREEWRVDVRSGALLGDARPGQPARPDLATVEETVRAARDAAAVAEAFGAPVEVCASIVWVRSHRRVRIGAIARLAPVARASP